MNQENKLHWTPEDHAVATSKAILQATKNNGQSIQNATQSIEKVGSDMNSRLEENTAILENIEAKEYPTQMEVIMKGISVVSLKGDKGDKGDPGKDSSVQGPKGDKGDRGEKGDDGRDGIDGKDGTDGKNGKAGENGINGKDGIDGQDGKDGKDGSPDTPEEVVEKINTADSKIQSKQVEGLPDVIKYVDGVQKNPTGGTSGGGVSMLKQLQDVRLNSPSNNDVLKYDAATGKWINGAGGGAGGGHTIQDEGTPLTQRTNLNFVGASVAVTDDAGNDATVVTISAGGGSGDVVGPASSVNNRVVFFDGATGKLIKDSGLTLSGSNTGDQTSIVGITGTKAQFDTAVTDGNILYVGDVTQYTDEMAQDAVGGMVDSSLTYVDGTPLLQRAALTGDITAAAGSNATTLATVNTNTGSWGLAASVAQFTVNAKGLITAAANVTISIASTAISDSTAAGRAMLTAATAAAQTALLSVFVGDSGAGGTKGLVPAPGIGDATKYLKGDGTWATVTGGSATPAGANKQVQYNDSGAFGAEAGFEYDAATDTLTVAKIIPTTGIYDIAGTPVISIDSAARSIKYSDGTEAIGWNSAVLRASDASIAVNWDSRILYASDASVVSNWQSRQLNGTDDTAIVDWSTNKVKLRDIVATFNGELDVSTLTADRSYAFPDQSGTIALTSDITAGGGVTQGSVVARDLILM